MRRQRFLFVPVPFAGLFTTGSMNTVAIVVGAVVVVIVVLAFTLIMKRRIAPWFESKRFKFGFAPVPEPPDPAALSTRELEDEELDP